MADENKVFDVEIITPDRVFFTGTATMIEFNTAAGELGVYARHIPLTTVLAPGVVTIHKQARRISLLRSIPGLQRSCRKR